MHTPNHRRQPRALCSHWPATPRVPRGRLIVEEAVRELGMDREGSGRLGNGNNAPGRGRAGER